MIYLPPPGPFAKFSQVEDDAPAAKPAILEPRRAIAIKWLGIVQIGIGTTCFILQLYVLILESHLFTFGAGIWGGIVFFVSGLYAMLSASSKTIGTVIGAMIVSTIAAFCAAAVILSSVIGIISRTSSRCSLDPKDCAEREYDRARTQRICTALDISMASLGFVEVILAVCVTICCCLSFGNPRPLRTTRKRLGDINWLESRS